MMRSIIFHDMGTLHEVGMLVSIWNMVTCVCWHHALDAFVSQWQCQEL